MNVSRLLQAVIAAAVLGLTGWLLLKLWPTDDRTVASLETQTGKAATLVQLTAAKESVAGIRTAPVSRSDLVLTKTFPARFAYDDRQHVAVRTPADAVMDQLLVKPGDEVTAETPLAILRSSTVGEARSEVLRRQADLELLEARRLQMAEIQSAVNRLVASIRSEQDLDVIEREFAGATLGKYRMELLANYSKLQLARQLAESASGSQGGISGRIVQERISQQQQSRAELEGAIEMATFETKQAVRAAEADVDAAKRSLSIARQELALTLGVDADHAEALKVSPNESQLTRLEIKSPIKGTVEQIHFSATERLRAGDELFIVADTSRLWVEADIRGQDWTAVGVAPGLEVEVTTPANPDFEVGAKVYYVGREVDPSTGAIPLVAELPNESGMLRPGLFARVEIPVGTVQDAIVIPRTAIIDLLGETSVFVVKDGGYEPVAVETGKSTVDEMEILAGLAEGQQVVVEGVFMLKSELLLEGEE
jgi:RND family efflux transporter MFP subunit